MTNFEYLNKVLLSFPQSLTATLPQRWLLLDSFQFIKFMQSSKTEEEEKTSEKWSEEFANSELSELTTKQFNDIWQGDEESGSADNDYSNQFWKKLQKEWEKMSEQEGGEPTWEKEYSEFIDPFKVT